MGRGNFVKLITTVYITVIIAGLIGLIVIYIDNNILRATLLGLLVLIVGLFSKYVKERN